MNDNQKIETRSGWNNSNACKTNDSEKRICIENAKQILEDRKKIIQNGEQMKISENKTAMEYAIDYENE